MRPRIVSFVQPPAATWAVASEDIVVFIVLGNGSEDLNLLEVAKPNAIDYGSLDFIIGVPRLVIWRDCQIWNQ